MSLDSFFAEDPGYPQWLADHQDGFVARLAVMNGGLNVHRVWCEEAIPSGDSAGGMSAIRLCAGSMDDLEFWADGRMVIGISGCPRCATPKLELSPEDIFG